MRTALGIGISVAFALSCGNREPRTGAAAEVPPTPQAPPMPTDRPIAAPDAGLVDAGPGDAPNHAATTDLVASREIVGIPTAQAIARSTKVASYRLDSRDYDAKATAADRFDGFRITAPGGVAGAVFVAQLAALTASDQSYVRIDKNVCRADVAIGLRLDGAGEQIDLLLVFPCNRISFLRRASNDPLKFPGEYFDPAAAAFAALVKPLFATDAEVQAL